MALTFANLKSYVKHFHSGDPNSVVTDADTTKGFVVNQAGRYLFSMHRWSWATGAESSLTITGSQTYIDLPSDFHQLQGLTYVNAGLGGNMARTTMSRLSFLRNSTTSGSFARRFFAISQPSQTATTSYMPTRRLELSWTPGATEANAIKITYEKKWLELSDDAAVPNIPEEFEHLLLMLINAHQFELDGTQFLAALDRINGSSYIHNMKMADADHLDTGVEMTGGFLEPEGGRIRAYDTYTAPT